MDCVKEYKTDKGTVKIYPDSCAESPRDWDNIVTLHTTDGCPYFDNESKFDSYEDLIEYYGVERSGYDWKAMHRDARTLVEAAKKKGDILKPISVYSHSGDSIYIGLPADHFDGRWDCSLLGFGIDDSETIKNEFNGDTEVAERVFDGEIKTLSEYVAGEVYGYKLFNEEDEEIDSCWGFYGDNPAENGMEDYVGKEVA